MASEQYGGQQQTNEELKDKIQKLHVSVSDLFDISKPWVLVPNGSLLGFFDWVPEHLRVGPWSSLGMAYLFMILYLVCMTLAWWKTQEVPPFDLTYDAFGTRFWYYNAFGFLWTTLVCLSVLLGPAGAKPWATFTMWAWTFLTLRHGLSTLVPFLPKDSNNVLLLLLLLSTLEYSRFPTLIMASVTFGMWNFVIGPFIYFFGMKTPEMKRKFIKYFTSFRLTQLHVANIGLAIGNCVVASPSRPLNHGDMLASFLVAIVYFLFYLLVLDRIGVHLYPVFSPRTPWLVLSWTFMIGSYFGGYYFWNGVLTKGVWRTTFSPPIVL